MEAVAFSLFGWSACKDTKTTFYTFFVIHPSLSSAKREDAMLGAGYVGLGFSGMFQFGNEVHISDVYPQNMIFVRVYDYVKHYIL